MKWKVLRTVNVHNQRNHALLTGGGFFYSEQRATGAIGTLDIWVNVKRSSLASRAPWWASFMDLFRRLLAALKSFLTCFLLYLVSKRTTKLCNFEVVDFRISESVWSVEDFLDILFLLKCDLSQRLLRCVLSSFLGNRKVSLLGLTHWVRSCATLSKAHIRVELMTISFASSGKSVECQASGAQRLGYNT